MADTPPFPHLQFVGRITGAAKLSGRRETNEQTQRNKDDRRAHSAGLSASAESIRAAWAKQQEERALNGLPVIAPGVPLLLAIDPSLDLEDLARQLGFEIVSELEDGFVIVAAGKLDLALLLRKIDEFAEAIRGAGVVASVHEILPESSRARLQRICPWLLAIWPTVTDDQDYIIDAGVEATGSARIPNPPKEPKRREKEGSVKWGRRHEEYEKKLAAWERERARVYTVWDEINWQRQNEVIDFLRAYGGEVLRIQEDEAAVSLSDSFTIRFRISGRGLKDFAQNYPYLFEITEPEDIRLPQHEAELANEEAANLELEPPDDDHPTVGIIDSGIQEGHRWLSPAVDAINSISFLPSDPSVADLVRPSGHGTRVAGAVLFGETVPREGQYKLPCWIQNARVLDADNQIPRHVLPALATRAAVLRLRGTGRRTRLFNQSINATAPCRLIHMSAWAAEIDALSTTHDILVIQSGGNIPTDGTLPNPGILQHLAANRQYPDYLNESSSRVANPAQSLQALTVGSVGYDPVEEQGWNSFVRQRGEPSSFSRSGPGLWGVIKPEVVEYGGDLMHTTSKATNSTNVGTPAVGRAGYPELIRSTLALGPAIDRDTVGISFAAPKVTRIAAYLARMLPDEPTLLYRALIVQSARWPDWGLALIDRHRAEKENNDKLRDKAKRAAKRAEKKEAPTPPPDIDRSSEQALVVQLTALMGRIGFGIPCLERATRNSAHRITLITSGTHSLVAGACDIMQVPVPSAVRAAGNDHDVLIEVTLSYAASPRRTRRTPKRYLSVWLDWISNRRGESLDAFTARAIKESDATAGGTSSEQGEGDSIRWVLGTRQNDGRIPGVARGNGTVQKDWAVLKLHQLPETFCISVRGHKGWSQDPKNEVKYALAVSFEVLGQEVEIYDEIRAALEVSIETREG